MDYIILSMMLMAIGLYGLLTKRQLLKILVSIELLATAASMNFVLLGTMFTQTLGQTFLILAISTDTCLTGVVLSLFVTMSKKYHTRDIRKLGDLELGETAENKKSSNEEGT
jgi:NADH:ubiquinone oxidoreductase subunit K